MFRFIVALSVLCIVSGDSLPSEDRVVNGRTASINEFPHLVSIQQHNTHFCGGSIINSEWILTAAHCLADPIKHRQVGSLSIRAGTSTWTSGGVTKPVALAINHPNYDARSMKYDVGLLKLQGQLVNSAVIKPVKFITSLPPLNTLVQSTGWGKVGNNIEGLPITMRTVDLHFLTLSACKSLFLGYPLSVSESMICGAGLARDSCQGDSGGALTITNSRTQVGIVSWGAGCGEAGLPGVYTDLSDPLVRSFIQSYVGKLQS